MATESRRGESGPGDATLAAVAESLADGVLARHAARRERAARAICALSADADGSVGPLARALAERWREASDRRALARALATLAERDRRAVEIALGSAHVPGDLRGAIEDAEPWPIAAPADRQARATDPA